jgi:hypothetical protein
MDRFFFIFSFFFPGSCILSSDESGGFTGSIPENKINKLIINK